MDLVRARAAALAAHPAAPFITDCTQGRIELSHATFDNWITKTVNWLRMEADDVQVVRVNLPLHWMAAVWAVSVWEAGCDLVFDGKADLRVGALDCDMLVTCDPWGMAPPPPDADAEWFFPGDVRGMPDAPLFAPAAPGTALGLSPDDLGAAATGYAQEIDLHPGGRLQVLEAAHDLPGLLAMVGAAVAVDAGVTYGPAPAQEYTVSAR